MTATSESVYDLKSNLSDVQISIIVPVYNQERNVSAVLSRIKHILDSTLLTYEILVVNDGSLDNTLKMLQKEQESDSSVKVISYTPNRGKGHAVKTGVLSSRGETVMFMDGDLDISPSAIKNYVRELENSDLVIASKKHPLSKVQAPFSRRFLSRAFNLIVQLAVGIRIKDTQSGMKAGNGDVLRALFNVMLVKRYAFDVEMLTIATALHLTIKELPIEISLDRRFKVKDIARMFLDVAAITYRYRIIRWYQKQLDAQIRGR